MTLAVAALSVVTMVTAVSADVFRPAYLELKQRDPETFDVLWKVPRQPG